MIQLSIQSLKGKEWKKIKECLDNECVSSTGPQMELFEKDTKIDRLSSALDIVRKKFDFLSIHSANVS